MNSTQLQNLSARKVKILTILAKGKSPKEIARDLDSTDLAIHQAIHRLRVQFDCQTTTELVFKAASAIKRAA